MFTTLPLQSWATVPPSSGVPAYLPAGCAHHPGWKIQPLAGERVQIMAHHGMRAIARDVRADDAATIVQAVDAHRALLSALRDAVGWLEPLGRKYNIALVTEAAARARAVLEQVAS
jgi:uncharacterized membrane protein